MLNPQVWNPGADEELEEQWFDGDAYQPDLSAWTRMFDRWNASATWDRLRPRLPVRARILEIGPGSGATLAWLRDRGHDVMGCDVSRTVCAHVTKRLGIEMFHGPISEIPGDGVFDAIVMNHIVEHVSDPVSLLKQVRRLLKPGGILQIAVPNIASWDAKLPGWTSYQPYHLVYYAPATLTETVRRAGLTVTEWTTREPFSGWFLAGIRTLVGGAGAAAGLARRRRPAAIEAVYRMAMLTVAGLMFPVRVVQNRVRTGEELVVLATRN